MSLTPKKNKVLLTYISIAAVIILVLGVLIPNLEQNSSTKKYSEIIEYFDNYEVSEYSLNLKSGELVMALRDSDEKISYTVPNVGLFLQDTDSEIKDYREEYNEKYPDEPLKVNYIRGTDNSWIITIIPTILLLVMGIALFFFMIRQAGGGGKYNNFGKANVRPANGKKTTFDDVAGADEEKEELKEIVDFLKNPKKYEDRKSVV